MADLISTVKPQCGGGGSNAEEYDLPLHVVALFLVLGFSCAGAGFPVVAKRISWVRIPPSIFFACKHFGTGVLVATAFVHLIPTAFQSLNNPCLPDLLTDKYPAMPGVIMMFALFSLFLIEVYLKGKTGGHSHGGPTGQAPTQIHHTYNPNLRTMSTDSFNSIANLKSNSYPNEKEIGLAHYPVDDYERKEYDDIKQYGSEAEMSPWFQVFFAQYVRQHEELKIAISNISARNQPSAPYRPQNTEKALELSDPTIDAATYRKMNLNITLLEGGILFHSVFVGMTVSITTNGFIILLIAILFHQFFEGLGLGSRIAAVPYPKGAAKPWVLVFAFGTTAPIGMAIGLITRNTYDPSSAFALILVGAFNAFSSGLLLYAATVDLLAEDFLSEEAQLLMTKQMKIKAFTYIIMGAAGMSIVGAFA